MIAASPERFPATAVRPGVEAAVFPRSLFRAGPGAGVLAQTGRCSISSACTAARGCRGSPVSGRAKWTRCSSATASRCDFAAPEAR